MSIDYNKYRINLNNGLLTIGIDERSDRKPKLYFHGGGGRVNFDLNEYDNTIKIMEELGSIDNQKEKEKQISLNEFVKFHRKFVSDISKPYNYEFRISERDKRRNESKTIELNGIEQLNLAKETLIWLNEKYTDEVWLDEKIRSEEFQYVEFNGKKFEVEKNYGRL